MRVLSATQVRNEWSEVVDSVIREKPTFIKRTRDFLFLSDMNVLESILSVYRFHAETMTEDDGSITISLDEIELVENAKDAHSAILSLAGAILEYSEDYYNDFAYWSRGDRKAHLPYVLKALTLNDPVKIGGIIECRHGEG